MDNEARVLFRIIEWTYQFYLSRYEDIPGYNTQRWGCFSYDYLSERQAIHMHFANLDFSGYGPLMHGEF